MTDQELMRHFGKDKDIAALLGITVQAVGQWKRNGMPYAVRKFLELRIERDDLLHELKAAADELDRVKAIMLRECGIGVVNNISISNARAAIAKATGENI